MILDKRIKKVFIKRHRKIKYNAIKKVKSKCFKYNIYQNKKYLINKNLCIKLNLINMYNILGGLYSLYLNHIKMLLKSFNILKIILFKNFLFKKDKKVAKYIHV